MKSFFRILLFSLFCLSRSAGVWADEAVLMDTVQVVPAPSIGEVAVIEDSSQSAQKEKWKKDRYAYEYFKPDPRRATWYALVCPGLGQIYNRSYWKLPILYGGLLTFSYFIGWNGRMYNSYHNAYRDILDNDPSTQSYMDLFPKYDGTQSWLASTLKSKTTRYRRYRDLSTFGLVAFYMVSVIDAFVDAHLYDFSVTDDLSLRLEPVINVYGFGNDVESRNSAIVGLQCSFQFK